LEGQGLQEVAKHLHDNADGHANQDVFEVPLGEILVHKLEELDQHGQPCGITQRRVDAESLPQECPGNEQGEGDQG
jgi:hypothetical protein